MEQQGLSNNLEAVTRKWSHYSIRVSVSMHTGHVCDRTIEYDWQLLKWSDVVISTAALCLM